MYNNSPYKEIPEELLEKYTMGSKIPILNWWRDDSKRSDNDWTDWNDNFIDNFVTTYSCENILNKRLKNEHYPGASFLLLHAFIKYNIKNKNIAVIGSLTPWIEAILINLNNTVTTVEYNTPKCNYKKIKCIDYFNDFENTVNLYDCIVSFSSVEHSGLGRYGDQLDPDGDLKTMNIIHKNLKNNGILIWGAPIGADAVVWNVHRVYGNIRLPLLFNGFHELDCIGFNKKQLLSQPLKNNGSQPVIVLKKIL